MESSDLQVNNYFGADSKKMFKLISNVGGWKNLFTSRYGTISLHEFFPNSINDSGASGVFWIERLITKTGEPNSRATTLILVLERPATNENNGRICDMVLNEFTKPNVITEIEALVAIDDPAAIQQFVVELGRRIDKLIDVNRWAIEPRSSGINIRQFLFFFASVVFGMTSLLLLLLFPLRGILTGPQGDPGPKGERGPKGDRGSKGDKGDSWWEGMD